VIIVVLRQHIHLRASTDRREDTHAKLNGCEVFLRHVTVICIAPIFSRFILVYVPGVTTQLILRKHFLLRIMGLASTSQF
jgi:hypothetical protein